VSIKVGYKASAEQFGPRELVEYAVRAEEIGLDSVVVSDHFLPLRHNGGHAPSALAWMPAVGERTSRIQIGTSVLTPTFRYNPAVIAQTFATMSLLYEGRIMLGVGTGEALNEVAVSGMQWSEFALRDTTRPPTVHTAPPASVGGQLRPSSRWWSRSWASSSSLSTLLWSTSRCRPSERTLAVGSLVCSGWSTVTS
jgi:hypothetical protein